MSTNQLLKLTLMAGIDVTAMSGTFAGASDEPTPSSAAISAATQKKATATGNPVLSAKNVWGHDYSDAWRRAKTLNRPVLLHFHATWCGPCRQMEREVLNSAKVLHEINACCIAVKVDCDAQPNLVRKFGVDALPCDVLVTPDRKIQYINHGFLTADEYSSLISRLTKPKPEARVQVSAN